MASLNDVLKEILEKDFEKIDAGIVRRIYDELCLTTDEIDDIASKIK